MGIQEALGSKQDSIGYILICAGPDGDDIFTLAHAEDLGYEGHKEHVPTAGNKFENAQAMKEGEEARQRLVDGGKDPRDHGYQLSEEDIKRFGLKER